MSALVSSSTSDCVDNSGCRLRNITLHSSRNSPVSSSAASSNIKRHNNSKSSGTFQEQQRSRVADHRGSIGNSSSGNTTTAPLATSNNVIANTASVKQCCFHWCCCCPCSCLALRATGQTDIKEDSSKAETMKLFDEDKKPTLEELQLWGESFDRLMKSESGRNLFREFLRGEYSEENILFWLACEELKNETNLSIVEERARIIYEDYISILSPKEVSLDSRVRELVNKNMMEPKPGMFDEAQTQIYTLMHRDSYPRFLNSQVYKDLLISQTTESSSPSSTGSKKARNSSVTRKRSGS